MSYITEYQDADGDVVRVIVPGRNSAPAPSGLLAVDLETPLLEKNLRQADRNRAFFAARRIVALNLVSSPGTGKTALLERTLDEFGREVKCAVLVGDLETDNDARRLQRAHAAVAQITTGCCCHLDAEMVARGASALDLEGTRVLFIENVGNLVCPASFDLGEALRIVLLSTTEGEDKPLKYPAIFYTSDVAVVTKWDLAEAVEFDWETARRNILAARPDMQIARVSAKTGEGVLELLALLASGRRA